VKDGDKKMTTLYANPYDLSARGFYFETAEDYAEKSQALRNSFGDPVEEFEIEFIDGESIDAELGKVWSLNQCNFTAFFDACEKWEECKKVRFIIAVGECGYDFDADAVSLDDVDVYECDSMRELAEQFVDEGLFGDIPNHLENYIDYDAIARDLAIDYSETRINGQNLIYRCA
tara:strand:+ start:86 stop:607 length:522 start_codon:yes stop_codon:yes gene_type:complete